MPHLTLPLILVLVSLLTAQDQIDTSTVSATSSQDPGNCTPEVILMRQGKNQSICLSRFVPQNDSCVDVDISFNEVNGAKFRFSFDASRKWKYAGISVDDGTKQLKGVQVEISSDNDGNLLQATLALSTLQDKPNTELLLVNPAGDIPVIPDTVDNLQYSISWNTFLCEKKFEMVQSKTFIKYTYPPGYGRREPGFNCAERSMFHHGSSVIFPTSQSVWERGVFINVYHVLTPSKLRYELMQGERDRGEIIREELEREKRKKAAKKPGWLQIKKLKNF